MKAVSRDDARQIAKEHGADRLVIITVQELSRKFAITTYGKDRRTCQALANWSEDFGDRCALDVLEAD